MSLYCEEMSYKALEHYLNVTLREQGRFLYKVLPLPNGNLLVITADPNMEREVGYLLKW